MNHDTSAYGLWSLVVLNSAIFIMFAFSFFKPQTARDWRTFGAFSAFVVALFVEMYGFPLTIYLLSGWLQTRYPGLDILSHNSGHLWSTLLGEKGDPHFGILHIASYVLLAGGFFLLSNALGIPIAAGLLYPWTGWLLSPLIAALAMSFSSVSVIGNALRLRNARL